MNFRTTNERLDSLERLEQKIDSMQRKIDSNVINEIPAKPQILPFSTVEAMQMFTKDNAVYDETVSIELIHFMLSICACV